MEVKGGGVILSPGFYTEVLETQNTQKHRTEILR